MSIQEKNNQWSRGQLDFICICPVCQTNEKQKKLFERRNNEATMPDIWRMIQCANCKSIWLNPRPNKESIPYAYDNYYTHSAEKEDSRSGLLWRLINGYLDHRFRMRHKFSSPIGYIVFSLIEPWRLKLDYYGRHLTQDRVGAPGRLLDIGCGNGDFLQRAVNMGWEARGCEVDPKAVATCRSVGLDVTQGDAYNPLLKEKYFDVITMRHVIEHVTDQQKLLRRTFDLIRPGGWLWIALPNPQSIGLHTFGAAWNALHPPCHLCIPSQEAISRWLVDAGFTHVQRMRRGAHARSEWELSQPIAFRESIAIPSVPRLAVLRFIADSIATFSPKWSEESVFLVHKPK